MIAPIDGSEMASFNSIKSIFGTEIADEKICLKFKFILSICRMNIQKILLENSHDLSRRTQ